jgi:hypothetical protein
MKICEHCYKHIHPLDDAYECKECEKTVCFEHSHECTKCSKLVCQDCSWRTPDNVTRVCTDCKAKGHPISGDYE